VLGAGIGRSQQHEDQIGRPLVDRLEVSRFQQAGKSAHRTIQRFDPRMWNRHALADAGRA
jgi:hypothetical protein